MRNTLLKARGEIEALRQENKEAHIRLNAIDDMLFLVGKRPSGVVSARGRDITTDLFEVTSKLQDELDSEVVEEAIDRQLAEEKKKGP